MMAVLMVKVAELVVCNGGGTSGTYMYVMVVWLVYRWHGWCISGGLVVMVVGLVTLV